MVNSRGQAHDAAGAAGDAVRRPAAEAGIGKYRFVAKLGQGGMADVFLAVVEGPGSFNKLVVVKRHRDVEGDSLVEMFLDEAKLAAQLNHSNIVHTYEVGEEQGAYFIAMEYLEGQTLSRVLRVARRDGPGTDKLGEPVWLHIAGEVLAGLHYAHELADYAGTPLNVVHRDMSPTNVFVTYDGGIKVIDFGIAKAALNTSRTETGVLKGKAAYMSPEQASGSKVIDRRADVFSVGNILWEMIAGRRLLDTDTIANLRRLASGEPMPRLSTVVPGISPELDAIVARSLEIDPEKRFATAGEMREALLELQRARGERPMSTQALAARMLHVFSRERAEMRAQVKRFLDEKERASLPTGPHSIPGGLPRIDDTDGSGMSDKKMAVSGPPSASGSTGSTRTWVLVAGPIVALLVMGVFLLRPGGESKGPPARSPGGQPSAAESTPPVVPSAPAAKGCKGTLRVRVTTDSSGTAQDIAQPFAQAVVDYLREVKASGGIRGCDIDLDLQDGHYDVAVTQGRITAWAAKPEWPEVSALFIFGTGPTKAVSAMTAVAGKTIFPGSYAGEFTAPTPHSTDVTYPEVNSQGQAIDITTSKKSRGYPYVFFPATDYSTGIRIAIQAAWKIQPGRLAMVYDKTCAYCTDPLTAGKAYVGNLPGMELASDLDTIPQTSDTSMIAAIAGTVRAAIDKDIRAFVSDPRHHPIKWLWCGNSVTSCAGVAKGAGQANAHIRAWLKDYSQVWTVRVIANNWGIGETSSALCGTVGSAAECDDVLYGLFPVPRYGDTAVAGGMQGMLAVHDKWAAADDASRARYRDVRYVQGTLPRSHGARRSSGRSTRATRLLRATTSKMPWRRSRTSTSKA